MIVCINDLIIHLVLVPDAEDRETQFEAGYGEKPDHIRREEEGEDVTRHGKKLEIERLCCINFLLFIVIYSLLFNTVCNIYRQATR